MITIICSHTVLWYQLFLSYRIFCESFIDLKITYLIQIVYAKLYSFNQVLLFYAGKTRGVVANVLVCIFGINGFKLQSTYYVHFRSDTLDIGMESFITQAMS